MKTKICKNKWYSVKDFLPKDNVHVLTYSPLLLLLSQFSYRILTTNNGKFFKDVKYWMFLPEPPNHS